MFIFFFLDKPTPGKIFLSTSWSFLRTWFSRPRISSRGTAYRFSFINKSELPNFLLFITLSTSLVVPVFFMHGLDWQSNWPDLSNHFVNLSSSWVEKGGWGQRDKQN